LKGRGNIGKKNQREREGGRIEGKENWVSLALSRLDKSKSERERV
jgi:hypothetical protein